MVEQAEKEVNEDVEKIEVRVIFLKKRDTYLQKSTAEILGMEENRWKSRDKCSRTCRLMASVDYIVAHGSHGSK